MLARRLQFATRSSISRRFVSDSVQAQYSRSISGIFRASSVPFTPRNIADIVRGSMILFYEVLRYEFWRMFLPHNSYRHSFSGQPRVPWESLLHMCCVPDSQLPENQCYFLTFIIGTHSLVLFINSIDHYSTNMNFVHLPGEIRNRIYILLLGNVS
jgi:hypothetical protein